MEGFRRVIASDRRQMSIPVIKHERSETPFCFSSCTLCWLIQTQQIHMYVRAGLSPSPSQYAERPSTMSPYAYSSVVIKDYGL